MLFKELILLVMFSFIFINFISCSQSTDGGYIYHNKFNIISDCVNPIREATIQIQDGVIIEPASLSLRDFGFPSNKLTDSDNTGMISGFTRVCKKSFGKDAPYNETEFIYSCFDNGRLTCTIYLEIVEE